MRKAYRRVRGEGTGDTHSLGDWVRLRGVAGEGRDKIKKCKADNALKNQKS
jgi:hypothetical protein